MGTNKEVVINREFKDSTLNGKNYEGYVNEALRKLIVEEVNKSGLLIVDGGTGKGKTTFLGDFIKREVNHERIYSLRTPMGNLESLIKTQEVDNIIFVTVYFLRKLVKIKALDNEIVVIDEYDRLLADKENEIDTLISNLLNKGYTVLLTGHTSVVESSELLQKHDYTRVIVDKHLEGELIGGVVISDGGNVKTVYYGRSVL